MQLHHDDDLPLPPGTASLAVVRLIAFSVATTLSICLVASAAVLDDDPTPLVAYPTTLLLLPLAISTLLGLLARPNSMRLALVAGTSAVGAMAGLTFIIFGRFMEDAAQALTDEWWRGFRALAICIMATLGIWAKWAGTIIPAIERHRVPPREGREP